MNQNHEGNTKHESITCVRTTRVQQNMKALHASEPRGYYKILKHYMRQSHEGTTKYESITCDSTRRVLQNMKALHASQPRGY